VKSAALFAKRGAHYLGKTASNSGRHHICAHPYKDSQESLRIREIRSFLNYVILVPAKMGQLNKRALLARLQLLGSASRAELAKSLGLSQPTAGKIVDEMLEIGLLEEFDGDRRQASALGRPGRRLRFETRSPRLVTIQLGVTETSLSAVPVGASGEDNWQTRFATPSSPAQWRRALAKSAGDIVRKGLWGVIASVPGVVDEKNDTVLFSPNLHWTEGPALKGMIAEVWDVPVALVQEERALAMGHQALTPAQEDFLLVDFGEGVGGAAMIGGKPFVPPLPISGELGHTPVIGNTRPCGCGGVGCLETLVSTSGLLRSYAESRPKSASNWPAFVEYIAGQGVVAWLAETLESTAAVIAGALNVCGLRRVIVTGSLAELQPAVLRYLSAAIQRGTLWARLGRVEVEGALRRRTAGLVSTGIERIVLPRIEDRPTSASIVEPVHS
jgi:predicted NBD/HSP70 family sugar kinase